MIGHELRQFLELMHHDINNTFGILAQHLGSTRKEINKGFINYKRDIEELCKRIKNIEGHILRLTQAVNTISKTSRKDYKYKDPTSSADNLPN